jgi:hypothetical protein
MKPLFYVIFFCISALSFSSHAQVSMTDEEMDKVIDSLLYNQPQSELSVFLQYQNRTYFREEIWELNNGIQHLGFLILINLD